MKILSICSVTSNSTHKAPHARVEGFGRVGYFSHFYEAPEVRQESTKSKYMVGTIYKRLEQLLITFLSSTQPAISKNKKKAKQKVGNLIIKVIQDENNVGARTVDNIH